MSQNRQESFEMLSIKTIFNSFKYWPRIFKLFWFTKKSYFIFILFLQILLGCIPIFSLVIIQELINSIILGWESSGFNIVVWIFIIFVFISLLREISNILLVYYEGLFLTLFNNQLTLLIMEKSNSLGLSEFEDADVQDKLNRAKGESGQRSYQIFKLISSVISSIITLCSSVIFIFLWKWWVSIILVVLPLSSFMSLLRLGQLEFYKNWKRSPKLRESWYLNYLLTHDQSFKEVKIFQLGSLLIQQFKNIFLTFYQEDKQIANKRMRISFVFFIGINLTVISFIVFLALKATYMREIMIGSLVAFVQAILLTNSTSQGIANSLVNLSQNNLYIKQLFSFFDIESSDPVYLQSSNFIEVGEDKITFLKNITIDTIEFKNVSFRYPGASHYALSDINFTLSRGQSLAIVGRNGSGKSTLIKLLTQLYNEYNGYILINGISIHNYDLNEIRSRIGIIFQDFMKYELPIRHNIGFGNIKYLEQDDKLFEAAFRSGIDNFIKELPNKLDSRLGRWFDEGHQLSGGQWQRIGLARAYFRNADIYILDEPSASLDPESENEVFGNFKELVDKRLGIFITHRYSSVRFADKILVMDKGRLVEQGNHDTLMKLDGTYSKLYTLQVSSYFSDEKNTQNVPNN